MLLRPLQGDILTVQVLRGEDLEAADSALLGGASDPFVVVHYGSAKQKTKVRKNTLNPVWPNAEFVFPMDNVRSWWTRFAPRTYFRARVAAMLRGGGQEG